MSPSLARPPQRSTLRRSLAACTAEGAAAEVVAACCGGAVLTGWALHLGLSARLVGVLAALPVTSQVLQVAGALLTARYGHRATALLAIALSRQAFLPLALLPWLPLGPAGCAGLLLLSAAAHHGLGIVANNAWNAWMGEMVPARLRGRYFGRRSALCTLAGGLCGLGAGLALDRGQGAAATGGVLQVLALVACAAGGLSVWLMARQHAAAARREPTRWAVRAVTRPMRDPQARATIAYAVAWNAATGLSAPFFGLFVLTDLGAGYSAVGGAGAGYALARVATGAAWGRAVDRLGARRVLVVCSAALAFSPLAWLACAPDRLWPLALETALGGLFFGGHAVAMFALPLDVAPARERPFYVAAVAVAGGAAFACTSALGGGLASAGTAPQPSLRLLFAASAALRLAAVAVAWRLPEVRARAEAAPRRFAPARRAA